MNEAEARATLGIGSGETLSIGLIEDKARRSAIYHSNDKIEEAGSHLLAICQVNRTPIDQLMGRVQAPVRQNNRPSQGAWQPPSQTLRPQDITYVTTRRGGKTFTSVMVNGVIKLSLQTAYTRFKFIIQMTNH
jgi:hypothetical protein